LKSAALARDSAFRKGTRPRSPANAVLDGACHVLAHAAWGLLNTIPRSTGPSRRSATLEVIMPERKTLARVERDKKQGKSASTQAGEFVREQVERVREGKHGVRSAKQAVAIGLSEARRAGVKVGTKSNASPATRKKAKQDEAKAKEGSPKSAKRSAATTKALKRESKAGASARALSGQARTAARKRTAADRSAAARKAARTKGAEGRSAAARKAARTRAANRQAQHAH
jgi:hypothetical protein